MKRLLLLAVFLSTFTYGSLHAEILQFSPEVLSQLAERMLTRALPANSFRAVHVRTAGGKSFYMPSHKLSPSFFRLSGYFEKCDMPSDLQVRDLADRIGFYIASLTVEEVRAIRDQQEAMLEQQQKQRAQCSVSLEAEGSCWLTLSIDNPSDGERIYTLSLQEKYCPAIRRLNMTATELKLRKVGDAGFELLGL